MTIFTMHRNVLLISLTLVLIAGCRSAEELLPEEPIPDVSEVIIESEEYEVVLEGTETVSFADSLLATMTLDEKIGQLFVIPAYGSFANDADLSRLRLQRLVEEYYVGGLIFFRGDIYDQVMLKNRLQQVAKYPLWITQDMEFGAAMRVSGTTRFTPAMGIAATGNPENAWLKGYITGREARALGVHQIFAPVLDVNNNPENPVINVRSFSADPAMVAEFGTAFIKGAEAAGVISTAKHFPGHGDTDTDSHLALPVISHDFARLDSVELAPFRVAVSEGVRSVMSAHISFPNISRNPGLPGTLDESILQALLVDSLGFDGLVVSDGLEMLGITRYYSPGDAVILALNAGVDMMLISPDEITAINELKRAVESGRVSQERIDHSVRKILDLKIEFGLFEERFTDPELLSSKINQPEHQAIADRIGRESVTLLRNRGDMLPLRRADYPSILLVAVSDGNRHSSAEVLAREFRRYHSGIRFHSIDDRTSREEIENLMRDARRSDLIVIGSFIMVRSHHPIQMPEKQLRILQNLTELQKPGMLLAFGNPYVVRDLPEMDVHLLAWSSSNDQVRQTIPSLFGASEIAGRFPGSIPGMYEIGSGIRIPQTTLRFDRPEASSLRTDSLFRIDRIMHEAIADSIFPGGIVAVMKNGALVWQEAYGYHDYSKTRAVRHTDVYDLASISKIMATTSAVMLLKDRGELDLDDPVARFIPEFDTDEKRGITIRHFLLHTSGLPAYRIYVDQLRTRAEILNAIRNEPLINKPGEVFVYSDLGMILLGEIVEIVSGRRLDQFITEEMFNPMSMNSTRFNPEQVSRALASRIPPTEIDTVFNRGTVHRRVHDERAWFLDGVAGHAGLFSSVQDISKYAFMMLNGGVYAGQQMLRPETISYFTGARSPVNHRGLGFDRKSEGFSTAGQLTGPHTFGHLGFTGTSLWIDPDHDIAIILLTNRTWPDRSYGRRISEIRAAVADAVMKSIRVE